MKFKTLLGLAIISLAVFSITTSCDDDINTIGEGIQPGIDGIFLDVDSTFITAETVSLDDNVYIHTDRGLLGELHDPIFKNLKAEFLAEFFCSSNAKFELDANGNASIDSVRCNLLFLKTDLTGDSISPMGISIYEVTKPLRPNFYTNINPADFCDMKTLLGQRFFSPRALPNANTEKTAKYVSIEFDKSYGQRLYDEWKRNPSVLKNSANLKKFMQGIYVTSNLNNKAVIELAQTGVDIYYSYKIRNVANTADSTLRRTFSLPATLDVIQMNKITNSPMAEIEGFGQNDVKSFIKAPAGVATKLTIRLDEIKKKAKDKTNSDNFTINSATFKLMGMTEEEDKLSISRRPNAFLFINKDSIENFFIDEKMTDGVTSMLMVRDIRNNTYNFASQNTYAVDAAGISQSSSFYNNIASLVNHYIKEHPEMDVLEYLVIPVDHKYTSPSNYSRTVMGVSNLMSPSAAVLRTKKKYMKMGLIFSKHNDQNPR